MGKNDNQSADPSAPERDYARFNDASQGNSNENSSSNYTHPPVDDCGCSGTYEHSDNESDHCNNCNNNNCPGCTGKDGKDLIPEKFTPSEIKVSVVSNTA